MFKISFMKNQTVTDEDINAIGYNLSNTSYTAFTSDTLYGVSALNEITSHIMAKGVKRDYANECALSYDGSKIQIGSGLAFFENGATITIDSTGIILVPESSIETQYIYLFFNDTINVGGARCTVEQPSGDFVMLGTITDGVITQDRTFAYINSDVKGTNEGVTLTVEPNEEYVDGDYYSVWRSTVNVAGYKKAVFYTPLEERRKQNSAYGTVVAYTTGVFDIQNNLCIGVGTYESTSYSSEATVFGSPISGVKLEIEDGFFVFKIRSNRVNFLKYKPLTIEVYGGVEA